MYTSNTRFTAKTKKNTHNTQSVAVKNDFWTVIVVWLIGAAMAIMALSVVKDADAAEKNQSKGTEIMSTTESRPMPPLNADENRVIRNKGTEAPFSGQYWNHKEAGTYVCRQCGAELYKSADKFDSGCGWPSFDDAVPGAVTRVADADGVRTEILCAACGGHLGHVFEGEQLTAKNTRHCVNSVSMTFVPASDQPVTAKDTPAKDAEVSGTQTAIFAGGCFWGVEDAFSKLNGVEAVVSGYIGGTTKKPTYNDVSTGRTGHAEAVRVTYDPAVVDYETLARLFFEVHDPGQLNRQGPDVGTQYRSAVFYANAEQKAVAEKLIDLLMTRGHDVVTTLEPAGEFHEAEDYHQDYTARTGRGGCHLRTKRFE